VKKYVDNCKKLLENAIYVLNSIRVTELFSKLSHNTHLPNIYVDNILTTWMRHFSFLLVRRSSRREVRTLRRLGRRVPLDLSSATHEVAQRRRRLEQLILHHRNKLVKEFMSGGYFETDELADRLDRFLQRIMHTWLQARLSNQRCTLVSRGGRITFQGRRLFLQAFEGLPTPLIKRVRKRLKYLNFNNSTMSQDYIRLEQVVSALRDKGCYCTGESRPYARDIPFEQVIHTYIQYRNDGDFVQRILQALDVIHIHKGPASTAEPVQPISDTKEISKRKNRYYDLLNRFAQTLNPEERRQVVQDLLNWGANDTIARDMIIQLARLTRTMVFKDSWLYIQGQKSATTQSHSPLPDGLQVGPEGLMTSSGQHIQTFLDKPDTQDDDDSAES
jgi:hypothetical protein